VFPVFDRCVARALTDWFPAVPPRFLPDSSSADIGVWAVG
jgi:hypothetical protein